MQVTNQPGKPLISVIVPCRNEREHISDCLVSIFAQEEVPGGFEVIVADGLSDDGTRAILERLCRTEKRLRVLDNPDRIAASGFNAAIRAARGSYVAIMGAHAHYASDYLKSSLALAWATGAENVGGSMICLGSSFLQSAIALAHHSPFSVGGARWHNVDYEGPVDTVFGGFYPRQIFDRIGFFDETLVRNQDDELNLRLTAAGGTIWHSPRIKSWYHPRSSLASLFRQYMQYGYWKVRVVRKHGRPASIRHLIPAIFVGLSITLPLFSLAHAAPFWLWLGLIASYLCCDLLASALTAARQGWKYFPILPIVFPCYHFGYGLGFLYGLIDFVVLRRAPAAAFTDSTRSSSAPQRA